MATLSGFAEKGDDLLDKSLAINITNTATTIDGAEAKGLSVYVETSSKTLSKEWKKYLKDRYDLKLKKSGDVLKGADAHLTDIWAKNATTVYVKVVPQGSGANLEVYVDLGGAFLTGSEHVEAEAKLKEHLTSFAKSHYTERLSKILKKQSKAQKKENKALAKLNKKRGKQEKAIIKANKKVQKANKTVDKANKRIKKAEAEIEKMKGEIAENEDLARTTEEEKKVTESEISQQQIEVGRQNESVKKVLEKIDGVKKL